jgi:Sulfotransferase domain
MVGGLYDHGPGDMGAGGDEHTVPGRIRERLPDVRLIAIMRDPVERARSHHAMAVLNGWDRRDFATAVSELLAPEALDAARRMPNETTGYLVWGEYGRILGGYLDVFPREQLLALYTTELRDDPAAVVRRVYEFLGVAADYVPDNLGTEYRIGASARRLHWLDLPRFQARVARSRVARGLWRALPETGRRRADKAFDRVNYLSQLWNRRGSAGPAVPQQDDLDQRLRAHFAQDTRRLTAVLGSPPPWA